MYPVIEMYFPVVNLPGGDLHVNMCVVRIAMDGGDGSCLREVFL
jgi:gamma-glutamylcysteine synthetase